MPGPQTRPELSLASVGFESALAIGKMTLPRASFPLEGKQRGMLWGKDVCQEQKVHCTWREFQDR